MKCRHCSTQLKHVFLDLGFAPPSNAYISNEDLSRPSIYYPLKVNVCERCWLVQTEDYIDAETLFSSDYAYFSSTSKSWLEHAADYSRMIINRLNLGHSSFVIEVASNDGYLLKNFVSANIPCIGIEPTSSTANAAEKLGIPIMREFFGEQLGRQLAEKSLQADLIIGNNVLAHVPDINDFARGLRFALKPDGTITLEFPHLLRLMELNQFDTIYHEHFSYLSFTTANRILKTSGLSAYDVEELSTHGGSLRVFCQKEDTGKQYIRKQVYDLMDQEEAAGMHKISYYKGFQEKVVKIKNHFLNFLIETKNDHYKVAGYGAAAKANTLLNFAGVRRDLLPYIVDRNKNKQEKYMPGSMIPIVEEKLLQQNKPDFVIVFPWNIKNEIFAQLDYIKNWGGRFVTVIPELKIYS